MKFAETELMQITEETWKVVLEQELERSSEVISPAQMENLVAACAQIVGDWHLGVILYCPSALARKAASLMFRLDAEKITMEDLHDALCELINIIAGNVKGLLSGVNLLSLPHIVRGSDFRLLFPRHVLLSEARFSFEAKPLLIQVLAEVRLLTTAEYAAVSAIKP